MSAFTVNTFHLTSTLRSITVVDFESNFILVRPAPNLNKEFHSAESQMSLNGQSLIWSTIFRENGDGHFPNYL